MTSVAVLGAGITGCSTALFLARAGAAVTLFDAAPAAMTGASRWNEGKLHLGFLYAADPTLETARRVIPGGLAFAPLVEELTGLAVASVATDHDDTFVIHRSSVVSADEVLAIAHRIADLVADHPDAGGYPGPGGGVVPLRPDHLTDYGPEIVAGLRVPERSVDTHRVADVFVAAIAAEPRIETAFGTRVAAVDGRTVVDDAGTRYGPFTAVVNALWEDRPRVDATAGLPGHATRSHRYRVALFARTRHPVALSSAIVCVGPFGDVKNYDGSTFYLSWYPTGLLAEGTDLAPPPAPSLDSARDREVIEGTFAGLGEHIPAIARIREAATEIRVGGGWVYASGRGPLSERDSGLHRRRDFGIFGGDGYWSVDTGKYSVAPWLARQVADAVLGQDR